MKLELQEHEIEQAIETYISSFVTNHPVKVHGFDLQGMRSKAGLSAIVDFTVQGVSDTRDPKVESTNVSPTNTEWRTSDSEPTQPELTESEKADWTKFLTLITDNPQDKNADAIYDLLENTDEEVAARIKDHALFVEMDERFNAAIENTVANATTEINVNTEEPILVDEEQVPYEPETIESSEPTEEEEEETEKEEIEPTTDKVNMFGSPLGNKATSKPTVAFGKPTTTPKKAFTFGSK